VTTEESAKLEPDNYSKLKGFILVLEDQIIHRKIIEHQLKVELKIPDSRILFTSDGEEALELIKKNLTNYLIEEKQERGAKSELIQLIITD
jgi:CheY-like chemotaxis protein